MQTCRTRTLRAGEPSTRPMQLKRRSLRWLHYTRHKATTRILPQQTLRHYCHPPRALENSSLCPRPPRFLEEQYGKHSLSSSLIPLSSCSPLSSSHWPSLQRISMARTSTTTIMEKQSSPSHVT